MRRQQAQQNDNRLSITVMRHHQPLPGQRQGRFKRERYFTFNVVVTGRCNAACSYCHYYQRRNRRSIWKDISDEQFEHYMRFIKYWCDVVEGETFYRFSGGDPMVLGDRLFDLAERAFQVTGKRPFVLTAGKALTVDWIEKAKLSKLSYASVSFENPFSPAPGAPAPGKLASVIRKLNSAEFPLIPGVCVIYPSEFKNLLRIADWFSSEIGEIPVLHEVNYDAYVRPTDEELTFLESNIDAILRKYGSSAALKLFPSISPELSFGGGDAYVFDLDLENTQSVGRGNLSDTLERFIASSRERHYPPLECRHRTCPWWNYCDNVKWYWIRDKHHCYGDKLRDYCRLKRILNDCFYKYYVDSTHPDTKCEIFS
jgi:MoaA/NifB/PqqE/SkfB family radical SAM enzyme